MAGPAALLVLLAATAALPGCGGGAGATGGGIGGSGYVYGPIEELGSIVVGGIRFSLDEASIVVNGDLASADDLVLGMVVGVQGSFDENDGSGSATRVEFEESASGPITAVSSGRRVLVVLGQIVVLDDDTRLDGVTSEELDVGVDVVISGTRDADDRIVASLVSRPDPGRGCRVAGDVEDLDEQATTFSIGDLEVDASGALIVGGSLVEGDRVGVLAETCAEDGVLVAREVRRLDELRPVLPGPLRRVRGFVREVPGPDRFRMFVPGAGLLRVLVLPRTIFQGGGVGDLARNVPLRVSGSIDDAGVLRAGRIVFVDAVAELRE